MDQQGLLLIGDKPFFMLLSRSDDSQTDYNRYFLIGINNPLTDDLSESQ